MIRRFFGSGGARPAPPALPVLRVACLAWLVLAAGCLEEAGEEEECDPAPWDCNHYQPSAADLTILVGGGTLQEVRVYAGSAYEEGTLIWTGTKGTTLRLPLGPYSATATYISGSKTVIAVDGDYLDYDWEETCEGSCYEEVDGVVDLTLED